MKRIAVLGSTGSIGVNALEVIRNNPERYKATALAAGTNVERLLEQIREFSPEAVALLDEKNASELKDKLGRSCPEVYHGPEGAVHLATWEGVDTVVSAMSGAAGLLPTYEAIKAGKHIALANKETIVMAGPLIMNKAKSQGVSILPIDSEHSALLQCLVGHPRQNLKRVILTASGGPFKDLSAKQMARVTPADALTHPTWDMGRKITIDSATMMNKGLEAIEAKWLFDLEMNQIDILIHPQSIVHSMAEYKDGSLISQLALPDMVIPISYALSFPDHLENTLPALDLEKIGCLSFEKPDMGRFRCLALALEAAETGGSLPIVLNGANEIAVAAFLDARIGFLDIPRIIEKTMDLHDPYELEDIDMVLETDRWARSKAQEILQTSVGQS